MINQILVAVIAIVIVVLLIGIIKRERGSIQLPTRGSAKSAPSTKPSPSTKPAPSTKKKPCPLCSSVGQQGDRIHSVHYLQNTRSHTSRSAHTSRHAHTAQNAHTSRHGSGAISENEFKFASNKMEITEILTHIFGCPRCWPSNPDHLRICPVCRQTLSPDGFLVARTFRRKGRKDHVHVIGCTECKRVR